MDLVLSVADLFRVRTTLETICNVIRVTADIGGTFDFDIVVLYTSNEAHGMKLSN